MNGKPTQGSLADPGDESTPGLRQVMRVAEAVADTDTTVLIRGESGAGKEVVARAIHRRSGRGDRPFLKVNCAALPDTLLEAELFGHERGAFTGAHQRQIGRFEAAGEGSIFLDEIGELPLHLQAKLLHVLQSHEFYRIGGDEPIRSAARVLAATNRDLEKSIAGGEFREDLYYRLDVVSIVVPPLRERLEDIPVIAERLLKRLNRRYQRSAQISERLLARLLEHGWPGNVRELENTISRLVLLGEERALGPLEGRLPARTPTSPVTAATLPVAVPPVGTLESLSLLEIGRQAAREAERLAIAAVLDRVRWNRAEAARRLQISYKALLYKIEEYGLGATRVHPGLAEVPRPAASVAS